MRIVDVKAVAARAHALWEAAGNPDGQSDKFWFLAERQLIKEQSATPDPAAAPAAAKTKPAKAKAAPKKRAPAKK